MTLPSALAVEAEGLTKHFGQTRAVSGLDFSIQKGELFYIVGPDGAGKSTTIRLLSGIIRPTSGIARIFGLDLVKDSEKIKRRIGYLSQSFTLYGDLTVDENIEFFARIHGIKDYAGRRQELLAFTRLEPFRRRLAENLSGGMKQKLALACTLIHTPDLLLLDEPTTGVDPVSRRDFWKIIFGLLQQGMTIIMTTPYLDEAERGSRVALMNKGKFELVDTPANMKSTMKGILLELVCQDNRQAAKVLKEIPEVADVQAFGDRIHLVIRHKEKDLAAIQNHLEQNRLQLIHWREVPPSLENVFIALTRDSAKEDSHASFQ